MSGTAKKTDPELWEKVKEQVQDGDKGGKPGQWSARKAQLAVHEYKEEGGGYEGPKDPHNHLTEWTKEEWGTKSGKESGETGERYLPKDAREELSDEEYRRTSDKKRADSEKGAQFSPQPRDVAEKTARHRDGDTDTPSATKGARSKADLLDEARRREVPGRSKMNKAELEKALTA